MRANPSLLVMLFCIGLTGVRADTILAPAIYSSSEVCPGSQECTVDSHSGDPAHSNISREFAITSVVNIGVDSALTIDEGLWRGEASVGGFINKSGFGAVSYSGVAVGAIIDNLTIPAGSIMVLPIHLTGSVVAEASASSNLPADTTFGASVQVGYTCQVNGFENGHYLPGSQCAPQQLNFTSDQTVDQTIFIDVPFIAGQEFTLVLGPSVRANLGMGSTSDVGPYMLNGQAKGDFLETAVLEAAQILDANGNAIPNVKITAESGFDFNNPPGDPGSSGSAVPEPRSGFLLAGAVGLLVLLRRQKG